MRIRILLLLATLLPCALSAQTPETQRLFSLTRPAFSGERARATVAFMDDYFRLPGNAGFDASIRHVEQVLKSAGYVEENVAPRNARLTYRIERRPLRGNAWEPVDASVAIVGESEPVLRYATNRNMIAIGSSSTPDSGVVAQLVDVGNGTPADFDRVDVRGKIVLAEGSIGGIYTQAARRGAIGAMAYRLPAYLKPDVNRNSIQFAGINDTTGRGWGMPISRNALDRLRASLARGPVSLRVLVKTKSYPSEELKLVAEVRGSVRPAERFVLSAHVQEPGANDNASGVGALAEMARVTAQLLNERRIDPKRTITMLFGDEIKQTQDYLADDSVRTRDVMWGLSLDMVGEDTRKTGGTFLIEKMPDPSAVWTRGDEKHSEWGGRPLPKDRIVYHYFNDFLLARCMEQSTATGWVVKTNPFEGGSDHTPFLTFRKPGVLFWHFTDQFYHTDGDRIENVSAETLANVGNCALVSVLTLTGADGATARALVREMEGGALRRIGIERQLSREALARGATIAAEMEIVTTWIDFYARAIEAMQEIETGGSSPETLAAIRAAAARVRAIDPGLTGR